MTGNLVLLGFAITGVHELSVPRSLAALVGYLVGALCGARAAGGTLGGVAFGIEPVILLAAVLLAWLTGEGPHSSSVDRYAITAASRGSAPPSRRCSSGLRSVPGCCDSPWRRRSAAA
jgi:uncharacterized membrane protein YoaK (UPF0700 family)